MSEIKYYDGELKDIIISIPTNVIEMTVKLKLYENGEIVDAEQVFDLEDIKYAEDLFEQSQKKAKNMLKGYVEKG